MELLDVDCCDGVCCAGGWVAGAASAAEKTTYKLIIWGTGNEVPSLLFDLVADPMENSNLIADAAGLQKFASVVSAMEQNLRSVVDYPSVAMSVATYGKEMMRQWIKMEGDGWKQAIHAKGLRWTASWDYDSDAAFAALAEYLATPPAIVACRNATVWPPPK